MNNRNIQKQIKEEWIEHLQKVDDINLLENLSHNYITILKSSIIFVINIFQLI